MKCLKILLLNWHLLVSVSRGTTNWVHFSLINRTFPIKDPQPRHLISTLATPVYHYFQGDNEFVMVGALKDWDRRADIHRLTMPTYLTFGGHETMPLSAAKRMAQTIPNATLHVTPNAGHGQMLDNPTDYFSHLGQWLVKTDAGSPLLDN